MLTSLLLLDLPGLRNTSGISSRAGVLYIYIAKWLLQGFLDSIEEFLPVNVSFLDIGCCRGNFSSLKGHVSYSREMLKARTGLCDDV